MSTATETTVATVRRRKTFCSATTPAAVSRPTSAYMRFSVA